MLPFLVALNMSFAAQITFDLEADEKREREAGVLELSASCIEALTQCIVAWRAAEGVGQPSAKIFETKTECYTQLRPQQPKDPRKRARDGGMLCIYDRGKQQMTLTNPYGSIPASVLVPKQQDSRPKN